MSRRRVNKIWIKFNALASELKRRIPPPAQPEVTGFTTAWRSFVPETTYVIVEAKGLEFDDVVILDGGWERPSRNEDQDAPRQLFYVAMTSARRHLIVMSNDNHEYLRTESPSVVTRHIVPDLATIPGLRRFFQRPK